MVKYLFVFLEVVIYFGIDCVKLETHKCNLMC
jgi:hypothetical protein